MEGPDRARALEANAARLEAENAALKAENAALKANQAVLAQQHQEVVERMAQERQVLLAEVRAWEAAGGEMMRMLIPVGRQEELLPFPGLGGGGLHAGERVMPPSVYQHVQQHLLGEAALAEDAVQLVQLPDDDAPSDAELPPLEDMSEDMREAELREEDGA